MHKYTLIPQHGQGRGRLVRVGNTVLYSAGDAAAAASLIGWCRLVGDRPAAEVLGELGRLASGSDALGPFCAVVIGDEGLDVFSEGGVPLVARSDAGKRSVDDGRSHLYDVVSLDLLIGDASVDGLLSLIEGVVAADGFSLRVISDATPWRAVAPSYDRLAELALHDDGPAAGGTAMAAAIAGPALEPTVSRTAVASGPTSVRVQGVTCPRGHFNDPRTRFCTTCGVAMQQTGMTLTEGARPPLGALVMNDGSYHTLVTSLVFGRDPDDDPEVRAGRAQGITLIDPGNTISRVHAEIRAVDWDVHLIDHGSTNGTFIWSSERQQWDRLVPHQPILLTPGAHIAFGRLTATYESSVRSKG